MHILFLGGEGVGWGVGLIMWHCASPAECAPASP